MPAPTASRATPEPSVPAPVRILLVEDSPAYARLVALLLEDALAEEVVTTHVPSLAAALAALDARATDVVLLDLALPDASGNDAVDGLCAAHPDVPVVVLSGHDDPALAAELERRGVGFVRKGDELAGLGPAIVRARR